LGSEIATVVKLHEERVRYRDALKHIAAGNISPAIEFAQKILDGLDVEAAHKAAKRSWRW
jgi:hypothetical protein